MPRMSVTRAPRARAASATAMPIRPVLRLPMKRTGSIGSAVPPAVTTTCQPARSCAHRRRARPAAASPDRAPGSAGPSTAATTASTIVGSSASRPRPTCPDASGPNAGSTIA